MPWPTRAYMIWSLATSPVPFVSRTPLAKFFSQISQMPLPAHTVCSTWKDPLLNLIEIHFLNLSRPTIKKSFPGHSIKTVAPTIFYIFTLLSFSLQPLPPPNIISHFTFVTVYPLHQNVNSMWNHIFPFLFICIFIYLHHWSYHWYTEQGLVHDTNSKICWKNTLFLNSIKILFESITFVIYKHKII